MGHFPRHRDGGAGVLLIVYPLFAATVTTIFIGYILIIAGVLKRLHSYYQPQEEKR